MNKRGKIICQKKHLSKPQRVGEELRFSHVYREPSVSSSTRRRKHKDNLSSITRSQYNIHGVIKLTITDSQIQIGTRKVPADKGKRPRNILIDFFLFPYTFFSYSHISFKMQEWKVDFSISCVEFTVKFLSQ